MKSKTMTIKINELRRGNNSYLGNPSWYVYFNRVFKINGGVGLLGRFIGKTASNASCGYMLDYHYENKIVDIEYHYTKTNKLIITRIYDNKGVL